MAENESKALKATLRYFDQLQRVNERLGRIQYMNIIKLNNELKYTKKHFENVYTIASKFSNLTISPEVRLKDNATHSVNILFKKLKTLKSISTSSSVKINNVQSSTANTSSTKGIELIIPILSSIKSKLGNSSIIQNSNNPTNEAPKDTFKAGVDKYNAIYNAVKSPIDLFNTSATALKTVMGDDKFNGLRDKGVEKVSKIFNKPGKDIIQKPTESDFQSAKKNWLNQQSNVPSMCCNCNCSGGSNKSSKNDKGKSKNKSKTSSKNIITNPTRQDFESAKATNKKSTKATTHTGGGHRLGIAGGAGILSMGGSGLGGMPTLGDMASRFTDKIAGSKSGMIKGLGKGLLSGGSRLFAPLAIASSIARVVKAKPEERSGAIGSAIGGTAGAALGGALGSVIPVFGTTLGAMAGGAIGSYVGGKLGETKIAKDTLGAVSKGITGTFDYLADKTKNIKEGFMSWFSGPSKPVIPPSVAPVVNPAVKLPATSIASAGAINAATVSTAQIAAGKTVKSEAGSLQQVQLDPTQMKTISGYLTDLKAQVTNSIAVNVPAGAVQVTVHENEIDYDALVIQIGQRVVNELRKSMQNRKPNAPATTSAKPIMA